MQYVINVSGCTRPYRTDLAFVAHDFRKWGRSVSVYTNDSPYITEVRLREQGFVLPSTRPSMMEIWATEVIRQTASASSTSFGTSEADARVDRVASMVQDFIKALARLGESEKPIRTNWNSPTCLKLEHTPLPEEPGLNLVVVYIRFLSRVRYLQGVLGPIQHHNTVDGVVLEFRAADMVKVDHFKQAAQDVRATQGRWIRVFETESTTGMIKVQMLFNVGDVAAERTGVEHGEERAPSYDGDEHLPAHAPL